MTKPKTKRKNASRVAVDLTRLTREQIIKLSNAHLAADEHRDREYERTLLDLLGLAEPKNHRQVEDQARIINGVAILVTQLKTTLASPPSNAYYRERLLPIANDVEKLLVSLEASQAPTSLNIFLKQSGVSLSSIGRDLKKLRDAAQQAIAQLEQDEHRGRPPSGFFASIVRCLGKLFEREYRGQLSKDRVRKGFVESSPWENVRDAFVAHTLRSHGLPVPTNLRRLFRQTKTTAAVERTVQLEKR